MSDSFKEYVFPSCPRCRLMRIAMCVGVLLVIGTYAVILVGMYNAPQGEGEIV